MSHLVTRQQAQALTNDINEAIADIFAKHGFDSPKLKTTFGDYYALKIESTPVEEGNNGINLNSPAAQAYLQQAEYNESFDADALGREFTVRGETFVFEGSNPRAPKFPYLARKVSDGRTYKFTRDIERFLGKQVDA